MASVEKIVKKAFAMQSDVSFTVVLGNKIFENGNGSLGATIRGVLQVLNDGTAIAVPYHLVNENSMVGQHVGAGNKSAPRILDKIKQALEEFGVKYKDCVSDSLGYKGEVNKMITAPEGAVWKANVSVWTHIDEKTKKSYTNYSIKSMWLDLEAAKE